MRLILPYITSRLELRAELVFAVQRAWRHHETLKLLYQQLAARAPDEQRRIMLLTLANAKRAHQQRYRRTLARLHAPLPPSGSAIDRFWLWLLPRCGIVVALRWAEWIERRDVRAILDAVLLLRKWADFDNRANGYAIGRTRR
ncbi:MAG TPA: hypothetical protein DEF43_13515 [Chloroflexus aurantiacus]|jgi:hypothetical protein|uniref:Uncharacterized protein n=1 Tax=Chloroflexus aurantiacus (strain ATCC 29366 / DSM 635 / J-10-fl) TaxID=324602 RepID=A9WE46_CHLAA|nr:MULTISPECIES: hypothetical protein [Chloroflexus]ABY33706.1 hypothetical protein Caur_0457 [Chloroflexus aurantiacus J-10-fl]RMG51032.1 MAG: hypothetical protein D6716_07100 [Chloroflexota bacterium]HBW68153.1 hypothetical protein [Chloroflexus aurantiacus]